MKYSPINRLVVICLVIIGGGNTMFGQDTVSDWVTTVQGDFVPEIMQATKISENPAVIDSTQKLKVSKYGINSKRIETKFDVEPIAPVLMGKERLDKLYNSLIKVGFGYPTTPYAELWVNSLRSRKSLTGARFKHMSTSYTPNGFGYAGYNDNEISVFGKKFLRKHSLVGSIDYNHNTVHLYGYNTGTFDLDRNATEQRYNFVNAKTQLKSHHKGTSHINHDLKLEYYMLMNRYDTYENNVVLSADFIKLYKKSSFKVSSYLDYNNYKTPSDTLNNSIISLNPYYKLFLVDSSFRLEFGGNTVMNIVNQENDLKFYPQFYVSYNIFENIIIPYGGIRGVFKRNSYKSLSDENPFVIANPELKTTTIVYDTYLGIKGNLSKTTSFNVSASQHIVTNMALFVSDTNGYENSFGVIYDKGTIINVHGDVKYQLREKIRLNLSGDYYSYDMQNELRAWYKPQVKVTLSGSYNIGDKLMAKVGLYYIGTQYEKSFVTDTANIVTAVDTKMSDLIDVNLGVEYNYNKKLGFFLNINNIANIKYYRWGGYPTQRFNLMGGLSFSF